MKTNISQLKFGVILSYLSKLIGIVVGLLYTPLMIRLLGQSEYGLYNIAASVIAYLGVLNFGFGSAYMRFYSRYKVVNDEEGIGTLNGMFIAIFSVLGLISIIAGMILAVNVNIIFGPSLSNEELRIGQILILILVLNLSLSFPVIVFNTYIQANERFIFQNIIQIIRQITTPFVTLPILLAGFGSIGMVVGTTIVNIIIEIIIVFYCIKVMDMKFSFKDFDFALMKEMTVYSSFIFINMIVDQVNNNVDKTILGRYQGTISVAIYSVASNFNGYYEMLSTTIANVFTPRIHKMIASEISNIELTKLFTRVGRIQFFILSFVCLGFIFFGRPFVGIWAGEGYYSSYVIALVLMLPYTITLIQNVGIEIQRAKNMHQFRSYLYLFMAIGNILVSIPLSIHFGAVGAAIGTGASYIIGNGFAMNWYNHKILKLDMLYFWREIFKFLPSFILPSIYGLVINYYVNLYILRNLIIFGILFVIIYLFSVWLFGLNSYEKELIKNPFK